MYRGRTRIQPLPRGDRWGDPALAAWLVQRTATEISPALLIMLGAAITTLALLRTEETAGTQMPFCVRKTKLTSIKKSAWLHASLRLPISTPLMLPRKYQSTSGFLNFWLPSISLIQMQRRTLG